MLSQENQIVHYVRSSKQPAIITTLDAHPTKKTKRATIDWS